MTVALSEGVIAPGARIGTLVQIRGAIARMRRAGWPLGGAWLAAGAGYSAVSLTSTALGVNIASASEAFGYLGYAFATALIGGVASAVALRMMLRPRDGWRRIDRGFLECVGIIAALTMAFTGVAVGAAVTGPQIDPENAALLLVAFGTLFVLMIYGWLKLSLWPIGRLLGRADITPGRSGQMMRKATRGLLLGSIIFAVPFMGAIIAIAPGTGAEAVLGPSGTTIALQFATAAYVIAGYALVATIYDLRVEGPASVADLFD